MSIRTEVLKEKQLSEYLSLETHEHEELGEVLVIYSPLDSEGNAPYFVRTDKKGKKNVEIGMGIRLTKQTAMKLALNILKEVGDL